MKSSDLKIVAIILSIALFFTIVTSNAVSVASVVMLAKGGTGSSGTPAAGTTAPAGTPAGDSSQTPATPAGDSSQTPGAADTTAPAAGTADTTAAAGAAGTTAAAGAAGTTAPAGGGQTQAPSSGEWSLEKTFNFYKDAVLKIKNNAAAGHTRVEWQHIDAIDLGAGTSILKPVIESFVKGEDKAEPKTSAKGSDDAKNRFPGCGATIGSVASATCKEVNGNYAITIVMKDEISPKKDTNGIASMSTGILYLEDVENTVKTDATVSKVVKSLDQASINYKAYTIEAVMTKDGKFVSLYHHTVGDIAAKASVRLIGEISGSGSLAFNSKWTDFKY